MPSHILVPLDGSAFSETILPHAVALAHIAASKLILLQVLEPAYEPIFGALGIAEQQQEEQLAGLRDAQLASIHNYLSHTACQEQAEVIEGNDPASCIVSYAQQDPCLLLIAMTTHGHSGVLRWLFGSVAAALIHTAPRKSLSSYQEGSVMPECLGEVTFTGVSDTHPSQDLIAIICNGIVRRKGQEHPPVLSW